jgi:Cd2+/Zn2+-exporting ATPase
MLIRARASADVVVRAVASAGMRADILEESAGASGAEVARLLRFTAFAAGSGGLMTVGLGLDTSGGQRVLAHALYALAVLLGLWLVLPKAGLALRQLRPDANLLVTVVVMGALGLAGLAAFLFALSLALESWRRSLATRGHRIARPFPGHGSGEGAGRDQDA